ncbi:MAG: DoxX family protein [Gemmatimonadetes bacterium]|nr:DoxX family protein [Gemmatimonadota bacterium]
MVADLLGLAYFKRRPEVGGLFLRLFIGFVLVYGTQDNVFHYERMLEFRAFLAENGFPYPMFSAYLSAYAQFLAGLLILVGLATRYAALVMIVNFVVALAMVHVGLPFSANIAPLAMLVGSVFLLFNGAGPYSLASLLEKRRAVPPARHAKAAVVSKV